LARISDAPQQMRRARPIDDALKSQDFSARFTPEGECREFFFKKSFHDGNTTLFCAATRPIMGRFPI